MWYFHLDREWGWDEVFDRVQNITTEAVRKNKFRYGLLLYACVTTTLVLSFTSNQNPAHEKSITTKKNMCFRGTTGSHFPGEGV